ncbi:MAG: right-handed parallel beta-helix repeat-containing protein [Solirubrobacteraceae bacterium]|nr:right-handed parallel beta-helix repeat-containing protein [Solirubrobacteraceae bacterium]
MSPRRLAVAVAVTALLAVGLIVVLTGGSPETGGPDPVGVRTVPASIAADCSENVQDELGRFFAAVPDGTTVRFRPGGCYAANHRIEVRDKTGLTIDGNGSTFKTTSANTGKSEANPNWLLLRGRNLVIRDMKIVGNFHLTGTRSQQRVNQASTEGEAGATSQPNAGIGIYGGDGITVRDVDIRDVFGDGVLTGVSEYVDGSVASQTPRDVRVERVTATKTARHCFSPNQVIGFWLEKSVGKDCWYGALDAELDDPEQQLQDVHLIDNTFSDFNMLGIFVPVAGDGGNTRDIEIRGNTFLTPPDQPCNTVIEIGAYPMNPNTIRNVVVEDNTLKAHGVGIAFDHVQGGRIRGNRIDYEEKGCSLPKATPPVRVTNSSGVTVQDNRRR